MPAGATLGTVPQKTDRPPDCFFSDLSRGKYVAGKGETVRQERTASPATAMVTVNPTGSKTE
ncbi:hypothetical protein AA3266_0562 [Gluconobacter kondonii NBRC 3266]|nr:hypothetical protein AA3266_0562 [Gluconobacter kondonii NBRC 3266]